MEELAYLSASCISAGLCHTLCIQKGTYCFRGLGKAVLEIWGGNFQIIILQLGAIQTRRSILFLFNWMVQNDSCYDLEVTDGCTVMSWVLIEHTVHKFSQKYNY